MNADANPSLVDIIRRDYRASQAAQIDTSSIRCVAMILGPYRNLTTLTSSIVSLHPQGQVLNHAGMRILPVRELNFLADPSTEVLDNFLRYAIYISQGGATGDFGGSITHSHAFEHEVMRETYARRYGDETVKETIHCLLWKESMRLSNFIREKGVDLDDVIARLGDRLRFIMPIRNPVDCAISNIKTQHTRHFTDLPDHGMASVLGKILDEIFGFLDHAARHPNHFFHYFQDGLDRDRLVELAGFLRLSADHSWLDDATAVYQLKAGYPPDTETQALFERLLAPHAERHPGAADRLRALVSG